MVDSEKCNLSLVLSAVNTSLKTADTLHIVELCLNMIISIQIWKFLST